MVWKFFSEFLKGHAQLMELRRAVPFLACVDDFLERLPF